jgi:hypothetical protein
MELTIQEQIKQCEYIIESGGACRPLICSVCLWGKLCQKGYFNRFANVRKEHTRLAKEKLKQLKGENMDIKDLKDRVQILDIEIDEVKRNIKQLEKEQEKEIEFVIGGEYGTKNAWAMLMHFDNDTYNLINSAGLVVLSENITKTEMEERFKECNYKYTGRTLADIIKK